MKKFNFILTILLIVMTIGSLGIIFETELNLIESYEYVNPKLPITGRNIGFYGNPNEAGVHATYLLLTLLCAIFYYKQKAWLIPFLLIPLYSMLQSLSRGSIFTSIILFLFFTLYVIKVFKLNTLMKFVDVRKIGVATLIFFIIGFGLYTRYSNNLSLQQKEKWGFINDLLAGKVNFETTSGRNVIYSHSWEMIKKRPFFGHGLGSFHRLKDLSDGLNQGVHNTYMLILGESGIIPLCLFLFLFYHLGIRGWSHPNPVYGFMIAGICIVFFINVAGPGHNALDERNSNAMIGIALALSERIKNID